MHSRKGVLKSKWSQNIFTGKSKSPKNTSQIKSKESGKGKKTSKGTTTLTRKAGGGRGRGWVSSSNTRRNLDRDARVTFSVRNWAIYYFGGL